MTSFLRSQRLGSCTIHKELRSKQLALFIQTFDCIFICGFRVLQEYVNDICWVSNTYYIPLDKKVPKLDQERRQNELRYYQWIPFILLFQAFCFYFPHLVWRSLSRRSGIDVRDIIDAAINYKSVDTATKDDQHKNELMEYIVEAIDKYADDPRRQADERGTNFTFKRLFMTICIFLGKYLGNYLIIVYFTTKALFIMNAVCQIFLLNLFLGQDFHLFGVQVLQRILAGRGLLNLFERSSIHC